MPDTKKAIQRLQWRFNQGNSFRIFDEDKQALNTIIKFYNVNNAEIKRDQEPFAKLYIKFYASLISYYGTTVLDTIPQIELHKILEKPLSQIVQEFTNEVNSQDLFQRLKTDIQCPLPEPFDTMNIEMFDTALPKGISPKKAAKKKQDFIDFKEAQNKALSEMYESNPNNFELEKFTYDQVNSNLIKMVNKALDLY